MTHKFLIGAAIALSTALTLSACSSPDMPIPAASAPLPNNQAAVQAAGDRVDRCLADFKALHIGMSEVDIDPWAKNNCVAHINRTRTAKATREQWVWPMIHWPDGKSPLLGDPDFEPRFVYFENGILTAIQD
jgi:hypothetical protein